MTTHYEPVEGERLEFEPEIYRTDDTAQIFGDDSRIPIGLREILVDPRLNPSKRFFCCGAVTSLLVILSVVFLFIIGGYFHVQSEIKERKLVARNGLSLVPELSSDKGWIVFVDLRTDSDKYIKEIGKYLQDYNDEQDTRVNVTRDCRPEDRPNGSKWCRFPMKKFIRAGKGCTADDKYGYNSRNPCILIVLKDRIGWEPQFNNKSTSKNDIPFKCAVLDTFRMYDEHINVSYYPAHDLNANYGAFSLNKLPSKPITDKHGEEICNGDNDDTAYDMPTLLFVKFFLPETFKHGVVRCFLVNSLPGAEIENLPSFKGTTELRFDIVA